MGESASVEVLSAEVRVLRVGDGQITLSMYRQLDEASPERFEPFGRVRDNERNLRRGALQLVGRDTETGALVRCDASPPDWSAADGPSEFTHWLRHQPGGWGRGPYRVAESNGRGIDWTARDGKVGCSSSSYWHINTPAAEWPAVKWLDRVLLRSVDRNERRTEEHSRQIVDLVLILD
jgi:hypothetical protein